LTVWSECPSGGSIDKKSIGRTVKGKIFLVPRDGFFQANLYLTDKMVEEVCRLAALDKISTIVDAYCGSGLFSVFLSSCADHVTGIEISEQAVHSARINAENLGAKNVEFISGDVGGVLEEKFLSSAQKIDLLILDPPRVGCEREVLKLMMDLRPQKIIYISCNPATQARDVKYLNECGYQLKNLLPLDMFPQTEHIEVIGFLTVK
ncbi:MAG: methyltransferase domain-containing protein, partial [Deltaproteobacteria bacterium]|nr:methyltransferase domain-containing protein [Deltaproteobacteria bacterium]